MPLFTLNPKTGKKGMVKRQCTQKYKIQPINRLLLSLYGRTHGVCVEQWFGISLDEAERERESTQLNRRFRYPLLYDVPMNRKDCLQFLQDRKIRAPKSACIGCPYRNRDQWEEIRRQPALWQQAVLFDQKIRQQPDATSLFFLHPQRVPLTLVNWNYSVATEHLSGFHGGMKNECTGMCGV
jgi:hypothetical protein